MVDRVYSEAVGKHGVGPRVTILT